MRILWQRIARSRQNNQPQRTASNTPQLRRRLAVPAKLPQRLSRLRTWHWNTLRVVSEPMAALALTTDRDYYTRAANEDCINGGPWTRTKYVYDVLGNLVKQTDAKNHMITQSFDVLNRMTSRTQPEGTTTWCYDGPSCTPPGTVPDIGQLYSVTQYDGYKATYSYDQLSRVTMLDEYINGTDYDTSTSYDADGRVATVTYPQTVADPAPTISAGGNQTVAPGSLVTLNGSGTASGDGPLPLSFQWSQLSGPAVTLSNPNIATPTFTAGAAGSTYGFQLIGSDGLASATATVTVTVPPLPTAPSGLTTDGDSDHNGTYVVSWNTVTVPGQTITYHLEQATGNSSGPTSSFAEIWSGTANSDSVNNSSNSSYYYYYRVRAQDLSGYSGYSSQVGIHVVVQPSSPSLSPSFKIVQVNKSYTESWTAASPIVTAYYLYEAIDDPSFGTQTLVYSGTGTSKSFTNSAGDVDYYYRVQACNSSDGLTVCSAYSNTSHVYIAPSGGQSPTLSPSTSTGTAAPAAQSMAAAVTDPTAQRDDKSDNGSTTFASSSVAASVSNSTLSLAVVGGAGRAGAVVNTDSRVAKTSHDFTIHYGQPVYLAYANAHFEPASSNTPLWGLAVQYTYTATGYLQQISNAVDNAQVFWTADSQDAFGQITQETYGSGVLVSNITTNVDPMGRITGITTGTLQNLTYQWDHLGNLISRADNLNSGNVSESFQYDLLNRLTSAQVTNGNGVQQPVSYTYDALGDITSKSDTGTYTYGGTAGPHAVTSIVGSQGGTYQYDTDGNMTHRINTAIQWNSDNLPTCIDAANGTCASGSNWSAFKYAPDKHRYYQSAMVNNVAETTVYSGAFEAWTKAGATTYRYHLMADDREVAEVSFTNSGSSSVETISYVLTDHLGSTDVVQTRDINNNLISTNYMSFGAWGNRRLVTTWVPPVGTSETQADHGADRYGFTHQEMLDNVALIHMNGRVYDPNIGRFLSVDPVFEFPTNTQSLNPYSYVLNNPLSMADPTGYAATTCATGTSCPADNQPSTTAPEHVSYTPTGSHIAISGTLTMKSLGNGNYAVTASNKALAQAFSTGMKAIFGNGLQNPNTGPSGADLGKTAQTGSTSQNTGNVSANTNAVTSGTQWQLSTGTPTEGVTPICILCGFFLGLKIVDEAYEVTNIAKDADALTTQPKTLVIGKGKDLKTLQKGERSLMGMRNQGVPKLNWKQNAGFLRQEMSRGLPIRDATVDPNTGALINNTGFLRAERNLLDDRNWFYDPSTTMWHPPESP
ncbi:MAG TPA: RHS repeat-associated core domain-containing protein [Gammaproteobacteria bacterium]|nr:RHS repeat-associated core domain-containing protein [Gammaproteobacteria bacterium]